MPDASPGTSPAAGSAAPATSEIPEPQPLTFESAVERITDRLIEWGTTLVELLPNIVVALLVVMLFVVLARIASRATRRVLDGVSANDQIAGLLSVTVRLAIMGVGIFVALGLLQLDKALTSLLAGVGIVGLALGFAFQDIAANFMSGIIMALRQPFQLGDLVETHSHLGHVERVTLRATILRLFSGQTLIVPNKDVLQNPIRNYTQTGERRVEVEVGVAYDSDLDEVHEVTRKALENLDYRDPDQDVEVYFTEFDQSSINVSARFWIDLESEQSSFLEARSRAVVGIKKAYDEAGIGIPFPIRTLDFDLAETPFSKSG